MTYGNKIIEEGIIREAMKKGKGLLRQSILSSQKRSLRGDVSDKTLI